MEYTVLWIDDDLSIVDAYQTLAEYKDINLIHKENWEDGKEYLKANFDEITAIILDANCKLKRDGVIQGDRFLGAVTADLQQFFAERQNAIPWYILSAGTMSDFGAITKCVTASRETFYDRWGPAIFLKDDVENSDNNQLFEQICKIGSNKKENIVLYRHKDTFKYLGKEGYISQEARIRLLNILSKLYYPVEINVKDNATAIRKIIEDIFRHAISHGIMPNNFINAKEGPILSDSLYFLCGRPANNVKYRLWDKSNDSAFSIFSESEFHIFNSILNFSQEYSHTEANFSVVTKEYFFSMALALCHIIKVYGNFIDKHPDVTAIQQMWEKLEDDKPTNLINHIREGCVECTNGIYHICDVKIPVKFKEYYKTSKIFRIEFVRKNMDNTKELFPYYTHEKNMKEIE